MPHSANSKTTALTRYALLFGVPILYLLILFSKELFSGSNVVIGGPGTDLLLQFLDQRKFAFGEIANGHFPLWNPHIYSGIPSFGNIQFALCYPLNLIYLVLPLASATNTIIITHLALAGMFMGIWIKSLGIDLRVSLAIGILYIGCGAFFPHIYAGHVTMICLLPWAPLLFWSVDETIKGNKPGTILAGGTALGMMILAGYPQFVFHLGVAVALYSALRIFESGSGIRKILLLLVIPALALGLSAFQIAATWHASEATLRSGTLAFEYASMFSLPPENLLTLIAPFSFGGSSTYWGRAYLWEMELFSGITTLVMACVAMSRKESPLRWSLPALIGIMLLFALGKNTPLFKILFDYIPGFANFRGHSKWALPATIFLLLMAAQGFQLFIRDPSRPKHLPLILSLIGIALTAAALLCRSGSRESSLPPDWWRSFLDSVSRSLESYMPHQMFQELFFQRFSLGMFGKALSLAAATFFLLSMIVFISRMKPVAASSVLAIAILEIFLFNRACTASFPVNDSNKSQLVSAVAGDDEYRVTVVGHPNSAMSTGALDIWGYDPFVPRRYAEFIALTQGIPRDTPAVDIPIKKWDPLLSLIRLRYTFAPGSGGSLQKGGPYPHLPRALLIPEYQVVQDKPEIILSSLTRPGFNPTREVILEEQPLFKPQKAAFQGDVRVHTLSTDELLVDAAVVSPSILLLTDPYDQGWHAEGGPDSPQAVYPIMRANYILQAIPLQAGNHSIRIFFAPRGLALWGAVSLVTAIIMAAAGICLLVRRNSKLVSANQRV
jgi:hypothetical protein